MSKSHTTSEVLETYRGKVRAFVMMSSRDEQTRGPIRKAALATIRKAKTFQEITAELQNWDQDGLFMYMVRKGEL